MRKNITTLLLALIANFTVSFAQWDFGGGGGNSGGLGGYTSKTDIDYVGDNHIGHKLDIYYPNDNKETHNVVIHIYGSAWGSNSSKGSADLGTVGKAALDAGYIFVTPNHRTYGDALWPAQINDIKAVVRYLRGNKADLKIDDSFIAISGFSSGGHLASMMGVTNGETVVKIGSESVDIEGSLGRFTSESSRVDAVCDWSGPVDCRDKGCGNPIPMSPENDMVGGCGPQQCPDKHATLGTNSYIDANDVPHMICHGTTDNIVPSCEGEKYAKNLQQAGIYVEWYNPGHGHQVNGEYTGKMIAFFNKIRSEKAEQDGEEKGGDQQGGNDSGTQTGDYERVDTQGGDSASDPKEEFHVYIAIGQSNMWGNAQVQNSDKATHDRIKMMSTANSRGKVGTWMPAVPPMCAPGAGYSLADNFIRTMADGMPECVTVGIIPVAIAGASFKAFDPNQCGSYFNSAENWLKDMAREYDNNPYKRIVECAKEAQKTGVIKGIIVHQGESDSGQQSWLTMVQTFYDNICKELGLDPKKTPILVGEMLSGGQCAGHNSVVAQLPNKISNCAVISSSNIPGESDRLHFTHDGYKEFGKRYAEKMLKMVDFDGNCSGGGSQGDVPGTVTPVQKEQAPYKSAFAIPGTVEAEDYDLGGANEAYYDTDSKNEGDAMYRTDEGVDIVKGGTGNAVGYTTSDEWIEYTVNVAKTAKYDIEANASNGGGSIGFDLYIDDKKVASIEGAKTSDWDTYTIVNATTAEIKEGTHILKVRFTSNNNNIDYIKFTESDGTGGSQGGGSKGDNTQGGGSVNEAGVYPISYSVENTGADCSEPSSLDKGKLKSCRTLPDPFEWADGSGKVTDFCDWSCRRNEIKREIEFWEIGEKPKFDKLEASYSGGTLTVKVYNGSNTLTLTSKISVPSGNGPHPIVIGMDGNTGSMNSSYFSKCIQVPFTHSQIAEYNSGFGGGGRNQNDPFYKLYPGTFNTKADYCAWSWGISRLIDGLEIVKDQVNADLGHIAVTGCSYAGKMALFAGAFDERVALTIAQESGGGGINAWRVSSEIGSSIEGISNTNYDWFLNSFKSNFGSSIDKLPYDHHELIAMIAPRAFLAFGNPDYEWLGDPAGIASLKAAEEVWKAMGIEDRFGYVVEGGHSHCQASANQNSAAQAFIGKFLYGDDSKDTKIRKSTVNSNHSSGKYDWGGHSIVNKGCGAPGGISLNEEVAAIGGKRFAIVPNPASTAIYIHTEGTLENVVIFNAVGEMVVNASESTIDVSSLPAGVYFVKAVVDGGSIVKKLIVTK